MPALTGIAAGHGEQQASVSQPEPDSTRRGFAAGCYVNQAHAPPYVRRCRAVPVAADSQLPSRLRMSDRTTRRKPLPTEPLDRSARAPLGCQPGGHRAILPPVRVHLHPGDIVGYQGSAFAVEGLLDYQLSGTGLRLARLFSAGEIRYLDLASSDLVDRLLLLTEIPVLDITTPPPATIYHGGESFLLKLSGAGHVAVTGSVPDRVPGPCALWRYRAAGDRWLQIEAWPDAIRMLEGATVHRSMIEIRPATP